MGIDYGHVKTNIDMETGIRYGVIPVNEVTQAWCDDSEAVYPGPCCPRCGNEFTVNTTEICESVADALGVDGVADLAVVVTIDGEEYDLEDVVNWCTTCVEEIDEDEANEGLEPQGFVYNTEGYQASQSQDSPDIFITKSDYYTWCDYCSPCAPGAGYLTSNRPFRGEDERGNDCKAYCFGHDWFEGGKAPYEVYRVSDDSEVLP